MMKFLSLLIRKPEILNDWSNGYESGDIWIDSDTGEKCLLIDPHDFDELPELFASGR